MNCIFSDEYSKLYDYNNYDKKLLKTFKYLKSYINCNNILINTHIDFGSGTGYFCKLVSDIGIKTMGIDISDGILNVARNKYPNIKFDNGDIKDYRCKEKVDFISCNFDTVNHLLDLSEWKQFFENVYNNLNDNGLFLFDFVTFDKFKNTNEVEFSTRNNEYDYFVCRIPIDENKIISKYIYYVKNNSEYKKVEQSIIESFYKNETIFNLIHDCGFKILKKLDKDFNELNGKTNRIYVICQK